ncbi:MAG: FAD-dependent oxidoreductase, partial [Isosphaeraceae bacterium]
MVADRYDLVVVGAGPGGYVAAIRAAQLGMKVACVEKRASLGGTCLNIGCIPSKALLDSSELYHLAQSKFAKHGIRLDQIGLDLGAMLARKDQVVKDLTDGVAFLFRKNKITAYQGVGRLTSLTSVVVNGGDGSETLLDAKHILLATGSEPIA